MTNVSLDSSQMIKQMGLVEQGRSEAHVTFNKSFYNQGDVATIQARVDNSKCDKDLKEVLVQLTRSIEWLSLPGETGHIYDVIAEQKYEGVSANAIKDMTLQLVLGESIKGDKQIIKENEWNHMTLEPEDVILQNYLVPTVRTNLIKCHYFIEIHFNHAGITFNNEIPKIVFPIYMFAPEINVDLHKMSAPLGYHPKAFDKKEIKSRFQPFEEEFTKLLYMPLSPKDVDRRYETVKTGDKLKMVSTV